MEFRNLPRDVVFDIFSRLPLKDLMRFRCVAKPWLSLIEHPHFIKTHLLRTISNPIADDNHLLLYYESEDYTKLYYCICSKKDASFSMVEQKKVEFPFKSKNGYVRIVGSSYGLVCLCDTNYFSYFGTLFLWNPLFRKFKKLPDSHLTHQFRDTFSHMVAGFLFVPRISDFKVVQILYDCDSKSIPDVLVYSMEANSWRKVDAIAPCYIPNRWSCNVYVNGAVHWLAYKRPKVGNVPNSIMSFDMRNEVFGEIALPNNPNNNYDKTYLSVSASGESLSLFFHFNDRWEAWLMKDYGVVESWMTRFAILEAQVSLPLNFMDNGDVLLAMKSGQLATSDPESRQTKHLKIIGIPSSFCVVKYQSSLVLLDEGDEIRRQWLLV